MFDELRKAVGDEGFSKEEEDLLIYSRDSSHFEETPLCIITPDSAEEVIEVVKIASKEKIPIIPRGAGTNPCGEVIGKAIIIDFSRMNRILKINVEDSYAVVEPGVIRDQLNQILINEGLFFPPDPASSKVATIGGMVSNNSSGLNSVMYGTTKDYVLSIEGALSDGTLINIGNLALKSSSGYDLKRLFIGSEGTLMVFTKLTLRLLPSPKCKKSISVGLRHLNDLDRLQNEVLSLSPSAFEFIDHICLSVISKRHEIDFGDLNALIIVEFAGSDHEVHRKINKLRSYTDQALDLPNIWNFRKGMVPLLAKYSDKPPTAITEDIGVPISELRRTMIRIRHIYNKAGFEVVLYGHLGDGNLHMRVFAEYSEDLEKCAEEVYSYVLSLDGTISSEHGIGRLRTKYMKAAHGNSLLIMKNIKTSLDVKYTLNPGCMFEE